MNGAMRAIVVLLLLALGGLPFSAQLTEGWVEIDYSALIDQRVPSHSGEPVAELLRKLDGRPVPAAGQRPADRSSHSLLDPLVEPYAFILSDALDTLNPIADPPLIELAGLWQPGQRQPAWVELLRARRYVVESDGQGRMRLILPDPASASPGESPAAAERAFEAAWPVVRHVFAGEQRRLSTERKPLPPITVDIYAYRHHAAGSLFLLGTEAHRVTVEETAPDGSRPPLDFSSLRDFLAAGLQLEGARLEADGSLRLFGSPVDEAPSILGRPLSLGDLAVAYRAVFHGGLAEPYMSLDRGYSPQTSIVNYGGRLRDTSLGQVSLLCDIRFKTFSLGLDIASGRDLREALRHTLPGFKTHLERFADDPGSAGVMAQQTRLWFYPDRVDMTVSPQGDLLAMRQVRMSAASERVLDETLQPAEGDDPPWTRATVQAVNAGYDTLTTHFPELRDLDQVVRLLSLFAWLRQAQGSGVLVPELDGLLNVALPQQWTPRSFPQLLSFNALPSAGASGVVDVFERVPVAEALERLRPAFGPPLDARRRFRRALAALDPSHPQMAALLENLRSVDVERATSIELDRLAYQAERQRMHFTVLRTLDGERREALMQRQPPGGTPRIFSVAIGGLDLGMGSVLQRATGRSLDLQGDGFVLAAASRLAAQATPGPGSSSAQSRDGWKREATGLPRPNIPEHGGSAFGNHRVEQGRSEREGGWVWTVLGEDSPDVVSRKVFLDESRHALRIERVHEKRFLSYALVRQGARLNVVAARAAALPSLVAQAAPVALPDGLAVLQISLPQESAGQIDSDKLRLDLAGTAEGTVRQLGADFPRAVLRRLVLGPAADLTPGQPLPALSPLPPTLGAIETLMVHADSSRMVAPWSGPRSPLAGEEDPARLARALNVWWDGESGGSRLISAAVATDLHASSARWEAAPLPSAQAMLLLPDRGGAESSAALRAAWVAGPVVTSLPDEVAASMVVVVSDEPPGLFAARLRGLAADPRLTGKLLAAWPLAAPLRDDLPSHLLAEGVAGVGIARTTVVGRRRVASDLAALSGALGQGGRRAEALPGPFLWFF